jgi:hypothetical protein
VKAGRLVPLGLGVVALLALAAIASHGRPLTGGRGRGPTATFFDYVATTLVLAALVLLAAVLYALFSERTGGFAPRRGRWHLLSSFVALAGALLLGYIMIRTGFVERLRRIEQQFFNQQQSGAPTPGPGKHAAPKHGRDPHLRWDEIGIFLTLIAGTAVVLYATRTTKRPARRRRPGRGRGVSAAIEQSIDDLRTDPDLRRAIVAAYARMEQALARAGLPRHPAEAPFEYVDRALRSLETSTTAIERLTALFEWAKFSQHEPGPEMRDEAIDALVAVRDELARPAEEAVPA